MIKKHNLIKIFESNKLATEQENDPYMQEKQLWAAVVLRAIFDITKNNVAGTSHQDKLKAAMFFRSNEIKTGSWVWIRNHLGISEEADKIINKLIDKYLPEAKIEWVN